MSEIRIDRELAQRMGRIASGLHSPVGQLAAKHQQLLADATKLGLSEADASEVIAAWGVASDGVWGALIARSMGAEWRPWA